MKNFFTCFDMLAIEPFVIGYRLVYRNSELAGRILSALPASRIPLQF